MKEYIGDGVYADHDGFAIILTAEDGISISDQIYLEPAVYAGLCQYVTRQLRRLDDAQKELFETKE